MKHGLPIARPGQVIGLLGGSFDPAHAGHVHITREALKRLGLDRVWWLVSPGNPLKARGPAPLSQRMAQAQGVMNHPRVDVTDIEARLGTRYTSRTIAALRKRYPRVHFVWLMGADNLAQFHRWQDWRGIMTSVPIAVLARPGDRIAARTSVAATVFRTARVSVADARGLGLRKAPAWTFLNVPMHAASSTAIRQNGDWGASAERRSWRDLH
ncbi:nicotinate-nucleotide adenylyltransferase [Jannaschia faecimaris]|uniref:Probable nicotinate-nucleotide adenylyltransferase n=1 Tax=Jannaschia faecimaris TaxID=1244108 RepID=A0A1H3JZ06_9RHOB|nr:nicotinate-nucleotide adenylyltransferase [Jannaschia faecimaris]SDY45157.1 nicotinate-nucleotide adenylyltransferase [Jannaschia faecimaris]